MSSCQNDVDSAAVQTRSDQAVLGSVSFGSEWFVEFEIYKVEQPKVGTFAGINEHYPSLS